MGTVVDCSIEVGWMDAETNVVVNIESGGRHRLEGLVAALIWDRDSIHYATQTRPVINGYVTGGSSLISSIIGPQRLETGPSQLPRAGHSFYARTNASRTYEKKCAYRQNYHTLHVHVQCTVYVPNLLLQFRWKSLAEVRETPNRDILDSRSPITYDINL
jgi:hypothetical protein